MLFFFLSKTLDLLVAPLSWVLLLMLAALGSARNAKPRIAGGCVASALAVLLVSSSTPVATALARALESTATTTMSPTSTYDVVVVLGGIAAASSTPETPDFNDAVDRLLAGYDVIRRDRARYIVLSSEALEDAALSKQLVEWGVDPERIVLENRSANTHQNAVESAKIIRSHGWTRVLLVTSAIHMPRAAGCFRAEGLTFDTLVVDRLAAVTLSPYEIIEPRADALRLVTLALREAVGRAIYRAVGYSR